MSTIDALDSPPPGTRPSVDHRVYSGFPLTEDVPAAPVAVPKAMPPRPVVEYTSTRTPPPAGGMSSDERPGHTRRVVLVGSLATLLVVGAVAASGVLSGADSDPTVASVPSIDAATSTGEADRAPVVVTVTSALESPPPAVLPDQPVESAVAADDDVSDDRDAVGDTDDENAARDEPDAVPVVVEADDPGADEETEPVETPVGEVAESTGVVRNGQLFLAGAVPDAASADRIVALAAEVLGAENVFNDYVIDPRASDPSVGNVTVEDTINFATGSSAMLPGSEGLMNQGLALMNIRPDMTVTIVGHTDSRGSDDDNLALSLDRAHTVRQWFVDRGIDGGRITVQGAGSTQPIGDNATDAGRRVNRRIQFILQNIFGNA